MRVRGDGVIGDDAAMSERDVFTLQARPSRERKLPRGSGDARTMKLRAAAGSGECCARAGESEARVFPRPESCLMPLSHEKAMSAVQRYGDVLCARSRARAAAALQTRRQALLLAAARLRDATERYARQVAGDAMLLFLLREALMLSSALMAREARGAIARSAMLRARCEPCKPAHIVHHRPSVAAAYA